MDNLNGPHQTQLGSATLKRSLRKRVLLGVALPTFVFLVMISSVHYWWEHEQFSLTFDKTIAQLNALALNNIKYALMLNDPGEITNTMNSIANIELVEDVLIVDNQGNVLIGNAQANRTILAEFQLTDPECSPCHIDENKSGSSELTGFIKIPVQGNDYRIAAILDNTEECQACHDNANLHLGVLLIDMTMPGLINELPTHLQANLLFSLVSTVVVTFGVYALLDQIVIRRVEKLRQPILALSQGNYNSQPEEKQDLQDELDDIAHLLNQLAGALQEAKIRQEQTREAREQAILKERERIAREIHDNVSQLLGYVSTKSQAVRLLLGKNQSEQANQQLKQLEEAAQTLYLDVRQMISELNLTEASSKTIGNLLGTCTSKFQKYSDVTIVLDVSEEAANVGLSASTALEMERIVREALTNVHKHASANIVRIEAAVRNNYLHLKIQDDGSGFSFNPDDISDDQIGLRSIHKRAMEIGADIRIQGNPGLGTSLELIIPIPLLTKV